MLFYVMLFYVMLFYEWVGYKHLLARFNLSTKGFRILYNILKRNDMLHPLPWCLMIGISLVVKLDPNLPSLSTLDSLNVFKVIF